MINLVTPLRPNQCVVCGGTLKLVEVERSIYKLNDHGQKESYLQEDFYDAFLKCDQCGSILEVEKHGNYYCPKKILPEVKFDNYKIQDFNPFQIKK